MKKVYNKEEYEYVGDIYPDDHYTTEMFKETLIKDITVLVKEYYFKGKDKELPFYK